MKSRKDLKPEEQLIVAADFNGRQEQVWEKVIELADRLRDTGVYLKVNSALRACGYDLIEEIHNRGLRVFADLKLNDIPKTLSIDGMLLHEFKPELLTVMCSSGLKSMKALKAELPETEILGVTVLTSLTSDDIGQMFSYGTYTPIISQVVARFSDLATEARIDGLVASPAEAKILRAQIDPEMTINTPAVRPEWAIVKGDDQNPERSMTPKMAIQAGADRVIIGRPITQANDPYAAVMRTLEEIAET